MHLTPPRAQQQFELLLGRWRQAYPLRRKTPTRLDIHFGCVLDAGLECGDKCHSMLPRREVLSGVHLRSSMVLVHKYTSREMELPA